MSNYAAKAKIAILDVLPHTPYLAILGSTYGGTIEAIGSEGKEWKVGERVVLRKRFGVKGNQYGAFQRYVVCGNRMRSRVPDELNLSVPASLMMNVTCVVGLFTGRLGLNGPPLSGVAEQKNEKILLYGGSSSFGGLSVQYLSQAGYQVITTSLPKNRTFVDTLGATTVFDHTQDQEILTNALVAQGPYDLVVDFVSIPSTISITSAVLEAQGGGRLFTMQPGKEKLPTSVERVFEPYSESLYEGKNRELLTWVVETYLPQGFAKGLLKPLPIKKVGGLAGINKASKRVLEEGGRYIVDPWE